MSFNIKTKAAADTFNLELVGTDDEPIIGDGGKQAAITVYGPGSKAFAKASASRAERMMARMAKRGKVKLTPEDQAAETAEFLSAITVSLHHFDYEGAATAEAIKAMYADPTLGFVADQVQKAVGDWANFTQASMKTSKPASSN